jgi:pyruvate formate lyase activating enzyme
MRPDEVLDFFHSRIGQLDAAVISGGEPTIQPGLAEFVGELRGMGFAVKLDTNGSRPEVLAKLLDRELLDYVAMDLKATPEKYAQLAGVEVSLAQVFRSAALLARSGIDHEFRTTVVDRLLSPEDLAAIEALVPRGSTYRRQRFLPELAREPSLRRPFTPSSHGRHR